jgi:hypothetical protein
MPDFLIPGLGPFTPFVRGIVAALRPGGSTPATAETTAAYNLERSRQEQPELWDFPYGAPTLSTIGSSSPTPLPTSAAPSAQSPVPPLTPRASAPAPSAALERAIEATGRTPLDLERAIRATEASPFERQIRATEAAPGSFAFGGLIRALGGIGALLWPSGMAPGTLTPEELRENERRFERATRPAPPPPPSPPPPPFVLLPVPAPAIPPPPAPQRRVRFDQPSPAPSVLQAPQPSPQPRSAPTATRSTAPNPFAAPAPLWRVLPVSSRPSASSRPAVSSRSAENPLTAVETAPLRLREPPRSDNCVRTRSPKRKCHASADVVWAGGPNKGQRAGRRCYSFEGKP